MVKTVEKIADSLQDHEVKVLKAFKSTTKELVDVKGLQKNEFLRAGMWLENKGLIKTNKTKTRYVQLDILGRRYVNSKLPELAVLALLKRKPHTLDELRKRFPEDELKFSIGYLKQKGYIEFRHGTLAITGTGLKVKLTMEFKFLLKLAKEKEIPVDALAAENRYSYQQLKKRKQLIREVERTRITFDITELGKSVLKNLSNEKRVGLLTPSIIKTGSWKQAKFRRYDVSAPVPKLYPGKKQPYYQFLDDVRDKLVEMGFTEIDGPIIETEFWNFDALFQPQNHPARTWTDTYSLKNPKYGRLPDKKLVDAVKKAHETGIAGSTGWGYKWDEKVAKQLMPRAHDTAMVPRYYAMKDLKIPGKYFNIARCYRPDVIDSRHAIEFNQLGGFVIGKDMNFRKLLGLLKQFCIEFAGAEEVRFVPDYFPFVEPGVGVLAKHPKLGWVELAGAGISRPEVVAAMGLKQPTLMWGFGIDRLAMCKLEINDIRYLFSQDLNWLRKERIVR